MNVVLSQGVFDIVGFFVILPVFIQLVDLTRHIPLLFRIKSLKMIIVFLNEIMNRVVTFIFLNYNKKVPQIFDYVPCGLQKSHLYQGASAEGIAHST